MITFEIIRYKNFLSTGNVFTEIQLNKNINTLIVGENGAGKSTFLDAICFALFGKSFRKVNKPLLLNSVNGKGLLVEVEFSIGKRKYKVIRGIKPNVFEIYLNDKLINQTAANKDYQNELEKNILKLNYRSFTQIVILGSSLFTPFMKLRAYERREIIEDLLDIRIFTAMNILLKEKIQTNKLKLDEVKLQIKFEEETLNVHKKYLNDIKETNKKKISIVETSIKTTKEKIEHLQIDREKILEQISSLNKSISDHDFVSKKMHKLLGLGPVLKNKKHTINEHLTFYESNSSCPTCEQTIDEKFRNNKVKQFNKDFQELEDAIDKLNKRYDEIKKRMDDIQKINSEISTKNIQVANLNADENALNNYLLQLQNDLNEHQTDTTNVKEEIVKLKKLEKKLNVTKQEEEKIINQQGVYDIAYSMLKDTGIKTQIIKQYVPIINKLVNKYLAALDFFVNFELDENFNEVIKSRYRDEFSYDNFSEGEKMRIDLALLFTWRSIAKMKNSINTNLLILDEVFDASLDAVGCDEFLKLLNNLDDSTNVFVISHKGDILQDKFNDVIKFEKYKNFSRIC